MKPVFRVLLVITGVLLTALLLFGVQQYGYHGGFLAGQAEALSERESLLNSKAMLELENRSLKEQLAQLHAQQSEAKTVPVFEQTGQAQDAAAATPEPAIDISRLPVQTSAVTQEPQDEQRSYIGNVNSKKFHLPSCKNLPHEQNRVYFDSRTAAVNGGYTPCGGCKP